MQVDSTQELLATLRKAGVAHVVRGGTLHLHPADRLPDWLQEQVREHADEVVRLLRGVEPEAPCAACGGRFFARGGRRVWYCWNCFGMPPRWVPREWKWFIEDLTGVQAGTQVERRERG